MRAPSSRLKASVAPVSVSSWARRTAARLSTRAFVPAKSGRRFEPPSRKEPPLGEEPSLHVRVHGRSLPRELRLPVVLRDAQGQVVAGCEVERVAADAVVRRSSQGEDRVEPAFRVGVQDDVPAVTDEGCRPVIAHRHVGRAHVDELSLQVYGGRCRCRLAGGRQEDGCRECVDEVFHT